LVSNLAKMVPKLPQGRCLHNAVSKATAGIIPSARRMDPKVLLAVGLILYPPI